MVERRLCGTQVSPTPGSNPPAQAGAPCAAQGTSPRTLWGGQGWHLTKKKEQQWHDGETEAGSHHGVPWKVCV